MFGMGKVTSRNVDNFGSVFGGLSNLRKTVLTAGALVIVAGAGTLIGLPVSAIAAPPKAEPKAEEVVKTDQVELIFRTGRTVKGTLISETASEIKVKVKIGTLEAETTYSKADILSVNRNLPVPGGAAGTPNKPAEGTKPADAPKAEPAKSTPAEATEAESSSVPTVYLVELSGEFGRDVAYTPFKEVVEEIVRLQPDYLVMKLNMAPPPEDFEVRDFLTTTDGAANSDVAEKVHLLLYNELVRNPDLKKKPKIVAWVNKALGAAAFLPFSCPNIYFTREGRQGGLGFLDRIFGYADQVVREKWRGAMLAGMKGYAIEGGHEPKLMEAMLRNDYVLSYKIDGGNVIYLERMPAGPDEFLLTDNAKGENADSLEDLVRFRGNDSLMLTADLAKRLGVSRGTADTLDDILLSMGESGEFKLLESRGTKTFKDWSKEIKDAEEEIRRILREFNRVEVRAPNTWREVNEALSKRKQLLLQVRSVLQRTKESINPQEINGAPEQWFQQIDAVIDDINNQIRRNRP